MIYIRIIILIIIIILAVYDVKYRAIPVILVVVGILLGIFLNIYIFFQSSENHMLINIIPAIGFVVIHFYKPSEIGVGDGLVLFMSELSMSWMDGLATLFWASVSAFILSIGLIILQKEETKIPFVLFIAFGHLISFLKDISLCIFY